LGLGQFGLARLDGLLASYHIYPGVHLGRTRHENEHGTLPIGERYAENQALGGSKVEQRFEDDGAIADVHRDSSAAPIHLDGIPVDLGLEAEQRNDALGYVDLVRLLSGVAGHGDGALAALANWARLCSCLGSYE
jgi:hypothetical protein